MAEPIVINDIECLKRPIATYLAVAAMVLLAGGLYAWHLTSDVYGDEKHTYLVVATGSFIEHLGDPVMVHPPLYFVCAWASHQLIDKPWAIRVPSVLFALATIVLVAIAAKRILGPKYVLPAAAVAATSPFLLDFAAEGRPYPLLCLLSVALLIVLHDFLRRENAATTTRLAVVSVLGLTTHLAFVFTLIFAAAYYLGARRKVTKHAIIAVAAVVVVAGVLLSFMLDDILFSNEATAKARESYLSIPNFVARLPVALTYGYCTFNLGEIGPGRNVTSSMVRDNLPIIVLVLLSFIGIAAATIVAIFKRTRGVGFIVLAVVVPIVVALIVGKIGFYYLREKYLAGIMGGYLLLLAVAMVHLARRRIGWAPIAAYVIVVAVSIVHYMAWPNTYSRRMDLSGLNAAIDSQVADGDLVVLYNPLQLHGSIAPARVWLTSTDNPATGFIRRDKKESTPPVERAELFDRKVTGTIYLVSLEATRNSVDPSGEVLETFERTRTVEVTRYGRNLTLYVLKRKPTPSAGE